MDKVTLETESYLVEERGNERFFPFLEIEYNETIIYENEVPKYYLSFSSELESANGFGNWFMEELQKKGNDLSGFIVELGKSLNLNWDVFYTGFGEIIEDSWNSEIVELIEFNDRLIEKLKTTPQHRV
ncbi:hypothetical protein HSX10_16965 [Winogradskyella undariae]|uniref:hypothetical protein n=1 Tax=Winogradskyella undariae TaxID=1285465 RepID=UPI00156BA18B|nr:hypothetical protein [Winogradskyella undariae]NRR93267.1 hypothetical protein [Winogradskyella undariae]